MSKSGKKKKKAQEEKKKARGKPESRGPLVALEGTRGRELERAAQRLASQLSRGNGAVGWSRWDASNTFYELRLGKSKRQVPPPRTLLLLYASDLLFRLRWEIRPALSEGHAVVVAPYVHTAIAFGLGSGLSRDWLEELFSFAPKADVNFRLKESAKFTRKQKAKKAGNGFVEFCCQALAANLPHWDTPEVCIGILSYFDALEEKNEIRRLGKKLPKAMAKLPAK